MTKEDILKELNLNEKEIRIYLALLKLGQSTVNTLAKKATLNRVTTYDILKSLLERGFVSYVIKSGVKHFEAADPNKLLGDLQEKEAKLKSILPELISLKKSIKEKPSVNIYEGIPGLKTVMEDILKEKKESWFIANPNLIDSLEFYFPHFITKKRKLKLFSRLITLDCKRQREYKKKAPKKYLNIKFIDETLPVSKIIYGNKVATLTFDKESSMGIITENKQIADTERKLFNSLWKSAKS